MQFATFVPVCRCVFVGNLALGTAWICYLLNMGPGCYCRGPMRRHCGFTCQCSWSSLPLTPAPLTPVHPSILPSNLHHLHRTWHLLGWLHPSSLTHSLADMTQVEPKRTSLQFLFRPERSTKKYSGSWNDMVKGLDAVSCLVFHHVQAAGLVWGTENEVAQREQNGEVSWGFWAQVWTALGSGDIPVLPSSSSLCPWTPRDHQSPFC